MDKATFINTLTGKKFEKEINQKIKDKQEVREFFDLLLENSKDPISNEQSYPMAYGRLQVMFEELLFNQKKGKAFYKSRLEELRKGDKK